MSQVYLALGSNEGDRLANLRAAVGELSRLMRVDRGSSVYETAAAYVEDQPPFLNAVLRANTSQAPGDLLRLLKALEAQLGRRVGGHRYGPRPIDIDILMYDDLTLDTPDLTLPHPRMAERAFVLRPLAEIAPELVPPDTLAEAEIGEVLAIVAGPLA